MKARLITQQQRQIPILGHEAYAPLTWVLCLRFGHQCSPRLLLILFGSQFMEPRRLGCSSQCMEASLRSVAAQQLVLCLVHCLSSHQC